MERLFWMDVEVKGLKLRFIECYINKDELIEIIKQNAKPRYIQAKEKKWSEQSCIDIIKSLLDRNVEFDDLCNAVIGTYFVKCYINQNAKKHDYTSEVTDIKLTPREALKLKKTILNLNVKYLEWGFEYLSEYYSEEIINVYKVGTFSEQEIASILEEIRTSPVTCK